MPVRHGLFCTVVAAFFSRISPHCLRTGDGICYPHLEREVKMGGSFSEPRNDNDCCCCVLATKEPLTMEIVQRYPLTSYFTCSCAWSWSLWLYLSFTSLSPESLIWKGLFVIAVSGPLVASTAVSFLLGGKAALFGLFRKTFYGAPLALVLLFLFELASRNDDFGGQFLWG